MFKDCAILTIVISGNGFTSADDIEVLTRTQLLDDDGAIVEDVTYAITDNDSKLAATEASMRVGALAGKSVSA